LLADTIPQIEKKPKPKKQKSLIPAAELAACLTEIHPEKYVLDEQMDGMAIVYSNPGLGRSLSIWSSKT